METKKDVKYESPVTLVIEVNTEGAILFASGQQNDYVPVEW